MLDEKEKDILVDAMQVVNFQAKDTIIKEGDDGDNLFVVEEGKLSCTKVLVRHVLRLRKKEILLLISRITPLVRHLVSLLFSITLLELLLLLRPPPALCSPSIVKHSIILSKMRP